jgi:hypothetical protein
MSYENRSFQKFRVQYGENIPRRVEKINLAGGKSRTIDPSRLPSDRSMPGLTEPDGEFVEIRNRSTKARQKNNRNGRRLGAVDEVVD